MRRTKRVYSTHRGRRTAEAPYFGTSERPVRRLSMLPSLYRRRASLKGEEDTLSKSAAGQITYRGDCRYFRADGRGDRRRRPVRNAVLSAPAAVGRTTGSPGPCRHAERLPPPLL